MTKAEAINELNYIKESFAKCELSYEALDMAIKALEEPQWIPCSDHTPYTPMRVQVQLDNGWIITAYRQEDEWLSVPDCGDVLRDEWVIAWRYLPEPWRGDDDHD